MVVGRCMIRCKEQTRVVGTTASTGPTTVVIPNQDTSFTTPAAIAPSHPTQQPMIATELSQEAPPSYAAVTGFPSVQQVYTIVHSIVHIIRQRSVD